MILQGPRGAMLWPMAPTILDVDVSKRFIEDTPSNILMLTS